MGTFVKNTILPGKDNNYLVGGNICNAFAIGELGSDTDFFLIGAEPEDESNYPLLTGNILDSDGNVLFRLVNNMLVVNPGHCKEIRSDRVGYEIYDGNDKLIFKVHTLFQDLPDIGSTYVTTISANFYNKSGELVFAAASGAGDERIEANTKCAFGFNGGFGIVQWYSDSEIESARAMLESHGKIHKVLSGEFENQEIVIDGVQFADAKVKNCLLITSTGEFNLGNSKFTDCAFGFKGAAENIRQLALNVYESEKSRS